MGCGSSKGLSVEHPVTNFFNEQADLYGILPSLFEDLESQLLALPLAEAEAIIGYLRGLDPLYLDTAAVIMVTLHKNWMLSRQTLVFFDTLSKLNPEKFSALLDQLAHYCAKNELFLTSDHLDTVIHLLYHDSLPEDALTTITSYVAAKPDFEEAIYRLRLTRRLHLSATAEAAI